MNHLEKLDRIGQEVEKNFSALSSSQINWKPEPLKWSIGQCLEHLIVSNASYFPSFYKLGSHSYRLSFFQKLNPFKKLMGRLMVKSMGSGSKKNYQAPKIFKPSSSDVPSTIVQDFLHHQQDLKNHFWRLMQLDTKHLYLASPVSPFIIYSLFHALELLVIHEERHLKQSMNVFHHPNFPNL